MQLISSMCIILNNGHKDTLKMCYPSSLTYMYDLTSCSNTELQCTEDSRKPTPSCSETVWFKVYACLQCMHACRFKYIKGYPLPKQVLVDHWQVYITKTPNVNIIVSIEQAICFKILKQLKKGVLHKHLATNPLSFGCECFCLKSSKRFCYIVILSCSTTLNGSPVLEEQ